MQKIQTNQNNSVKEKVGDLKLPGCHSYYEVIVFKTM